MIQSSSPKKAKTMYCFHCEEKLHLFVTIGKLHVGVCHNPSCPNYALLQADLKQ